jgi:hypothetical protein
MTYVRGDCPLSAEHGATSAGNCDEHGVRRRILANIVNTDSDI